MASFPELQDRMRAPVELNGDIERRRHTELVTFGFSKS
jgi:hypothetical protein